MSILKNNFFYYAIGNELENYKKDSKISKSSLNHWWMINW